MTTTRHIFDYLSFLFADGSRIFPLPLYIDTLTAGAYFVIIL